MVGYERHFGKEANCPLCKNMKKKSQYMEEKIFGQGRIPNPKPQTANPTQSHNDPNGRFRNKIIGMNRKEEEKNFNNNILKDLNLHFAGHAKNRMKNNIFRDMQRKYSAKKNIGIKNMYRIMGEQTRGGNHRNSIGSFSDVEFPAINSYFHS